MTAVVYIHGRGGDAAECGHYRALFPDCEVIGLDYYAQTPWEAEDEFHQAVRELKLRYDSIIMVANSIGAYYAMVAHLEGLARGRAQEKGIPYNLRRHIGIRLDSIVHKRLLAWSWSICYFRSYLAAEDIRKVL